MAENGDSASSFATSDKDLFLYAFVGNSTGIAVMITTFLIHVGSGWARAPISFSTKCSMNRGLNSE